MGVNGKRSGACHTCRRRRVKCDFEAPNCQRCTKAKLHCEGYERKGGLRFVDEKEKAEKRVQLKREAYLQAVQAEEARDEARQNHLKSPKEVGQLQRTATFCSPERYVQSTDDIVASRKSKMKDFSNVAIGKVLSMIGFQDEIHLSFLLSKFFVGARMFTPWMLRGCRWSEDCTTTQTVRALSGIYFGRMHHRKQSLDLGFQCYSKALRLLSKDLLSKKAWELPSLTNVLSLTVFEIMASPTGTGFLQHNCGIARLIQGSSPERFQSMPDLEVFESARMPIAFGCAD
ncbi:hypothetical protein ONS95_014562 [Cadophora gregata]|uniref:uncharacterized protein n=1 Tax=Cadophora gregata TaxID=51156 RepID=UPI0026DC5434|nr:uncharacterized protein ONS95_014562 [Cadophora gregata]KAK0112835.1 hypothetical protein ONS95_014562 [Cadophora gregata]KAK0124915.1 hypothetical protein ONS96_008792 [Cadophora gregata f. sp. sojae]